MDYSFRSFQKNSIIRFLALEKYNEIKEKLYKCDVSKDKEFQTAFNAFYRVRRKEKWRNVFYTYFETIKTRKDVSFDEILDYIFENTGNIEASFSSKMLSTINPEMPIWDRYVIINLRLNVIGSTKEERLESTKWAYRQIISIENELLKKEDIKQTIKEFREYLPEYELSDTKILDYIIWNNR